MEEVPRRTSLVPLAFPCFLHYLVGVETEGLLDYQGRAGDHFHCMVEPSPGHIRCRRIMKSFARTSLTRFGQGMDVHDPRGCQINSGKKSIHHHRGNPPYFLFRGLRLYGVSGKKKEPKPKLFGPDIFGWGGGLPCERVGAKKFDTSLETREIKLFGRDIPGFCRDIPELPEKFEKKKFVFNFRSLVYTLLSGPMVYTLFPCFFFPKKMVYTIAFFAL